MSAKKAAPKAPKAPKKKKTAAGDKSYGAKVTAARVAKGFTQRGLAAKLKVSQPYLCNVENGITAASVKLSARIEKLLRVASIRTP